MLNWLSHFKEKMSSYYSVALLLLGCVTGLSAAWLGWGVLGVFTLGMVFAKTTILPEVNVGTVLRGDSSGWFDRSQLKQTMVESDATHAFKKNPDYIL